MRGASWTLERKPYLYGRRRRLVVLREKLSRLVGTDPLSRVVDGNLLEVGSLPGRSELSGCAVEDVVVEPRGREVLTSGTRPCLAQEEDQGLVVPAHHLPAVGISAGLIHLKVQTLGQKSLSCGMRGTISTFDAQKEQTTGGE